MNNKVLTSDPVQEQVRRNLQVMVPRVEAVGKRLGFTPCRALFTLKSDQQVLDDLVYPLGVPVSRPAWWYGKAAQKSRRSGQGGHVFEFATISNPAHVVLGETNDLIMHIEVIIHAWMGHVYLFTRNRWHNETERETCLHRFAQDETFVRNLVADPHWGWEKYEYYSDAAHALEMHSGDLPTNFDAPTDDQLRESLKAELDRLQSAFVLAKTEPDKQAIANDIRDTVRLLSCHPIQPTTDLLGFLSKHVQDDVVRRIIDMTRFENRYSTQVVGRTKVLHEGLSHFVDRRFPREPELDLIRLGMDRLIDQAKYDTMHDAWPIYWYSDPYALGEAIIEYIDETYSRKVGKEKVGFYRLKLLTKADIESGKYPDNIEGDIIETDEWKEVEVDVWDRSYLHEVARNYDDTRLFYEFLTEDFFEKLHKKALGWVNKMIMMINKKLKDVNWAREFIFEGDRFPKTLEEMFQVISIWMNQLQMSQWVGMWFGYGAAPFPVSQVILWQMLQIVQTVAAYDQDKHEFKRQMLLRTSLYAMPNIKLVDTGRENKLPYWTLRHEYDADFGPLRQSYARETLRFHWRFSGPVRLVTMEILTDAYGRPWGPPRPYQYYTENGKTVKERWL